MGTEHAIRFGSYCFHPRQGLTRNGRRISVTPRSLGVLSALLGRAGEIVTKDELFRGVWRNADVSDAALTSCIQELRRALRDNARSPRYIETHHRRGFRFVEVFLAGELPMLTDLNGLNVRWFQAWLEKDAATVERLMAEDYVYIAPSGRVLDRQAILAIIRAPSYRLDHFERTEVVVRAMGNEAAVLRDRRQSAGSYQGASFTEEHRGVMVWAKHAGEWRLVMEQCFFSSE